MKKIILWFQSHEFLTVFLCLSLSILLRFSGLGSSPLSENESRLALQALRFHHAEFSDAVSQLLYVLPTSLLFRFFGAAEWTARLFPAICGLALGVLPLFMKARLGSRKALLLTVIFSFEPVLLFWSRRADGLIPLVFLAALGLVLYSNEHRTAALSAFLLTICGGSRFWPVLFAAGFVFLFVFIFNRAFPDHPLSLPGIHPAPATGKDLLTAALILVLFATAFLTCPQGLGHIGNGLSGVFSAENAWLDFGLIPAAVAIMHYCGLPLLLCVIRAKTAPRSGAAGIRILFFVVLFLLRQGSAVFPWLSLCAWMTASDVLLNTQAFLPEKRTTAFRLAFWIIPAAWSFTFLRVSEMVSGSGLSLPLTLTISGNQHVLPFSRMVGYLGILLIGLIIFLLILKIFATCFESDDIRPGLISGTAFVFLLGFLSNVWSCGGLSQSADRAVSAFNPGEGELLQANDAFLTNNYLLSQMRDASMKDNGGELNVHGIYTQQAEPILDWFFRNADYIRNVPASADAVSSAALIVDAPYASHEAEGFMGSAAGWKGSVNWNGLDLQDWLNWLIYGETKIDLQYLTLWQRISLLTDLFSTTKEMK